MADMDPLVAIGSPDWVVRRRAARQLARNGDLARLIPLLDDPYPRVVEVAAQELGEARYAPAVPALIACLNSKSDNVRAEAFALRNIGDPRAVEPLISLLERLTTSWLRAAIANVLGGFGETRKRRWPV